MNKLFSEGRADALALAGLILMATGWGSTFFVIKDILDRLDAADLLGVRFTVTALVLAAGLAPQLRRLDARCWRQGLAMGLLFSTGQLLQTYGLAYTSASISGFLSGLYVVLTPVMEALLLRARVGRRIWLAVALATIGLGVLTIAPGFGAAGFGVGEVLTLACSVAFAGHIVYTGRVSTPDRALRLSVVQSFMIAACCLLAAIPGGIALPSNTGDWLVVGYLAIITGAATIVLQVWAQARVSPSRAAIIMASEPIWAALFAILAGQEAFTERTLVGGTALVTAMLLASLPARRIRAARGGYRARLPVSSGSAPQHAD